MVWDRWVSVFPCLRFSWRWGSFATSKFHNRFSPWSILLHGHLKPWTISLSTSGLLNYFSTSPYKRSKISLEVIWLIPLKEQRPYSEPDCVRIDQWMSRLKDNLGGNTSKREREEREPHRRCRIDIQTSDARLWFDHSTVEISLRYECGIVFHRCYA